MVLLVLGLSIRFILMPLLTFELDMGFWVRISGLLDAGFTLYDTVGYYYTPIWGYIVAVFTDLGHLLGVSDIATFVPDLTPYTTGVFFISDYVASPAYSVMMKLPIVIADTVTAFLLYTLVKDISHDERKAVTAFGLWYLCPFVILMSSVHGMFDSISAMLILMTIVMVHKRNYFLGGVTFALAVLTKFFPIFFIFFLIAYVLKREGIDRHGAKHLSMAIFGALLTVFIVQLPAIVKGQFWESLYFLTNRVGLSTETMYALTTPKMLLVMAAGACILVAFGYWFYRSRYPEVRERIVTMDPKVRDRKFVKGLFIVGGIATLGVLAYSVLSVVGMSGTFMDIMSAIGMRFVMLFSIYTLMIEVYIAYRVIVADELNERTVFTALMLTSLMIFLWPALPQYLVVIVPFLALYVVLVDEALRKPFINFSIVIAIYEIIVINASALFTLAIYTDLFPLEIPIAVMELASFVYMGIPLSVVILAIITIFEYLTLLGMFLVWYRNKEAPIHG